MQDFLVAVQHGHLPWSAQSICTGLPSRNQTVPGVARSGLPDPRDRRQLLGGCAVFDWRSDADLEAVRAMGPFTAIVGAALRFEEWWPRLWKVLTVLSGGDAKTSIVLAFLLK